jgi:hypothetical protein
MASVYDYTFHNLTRTDDDTCYLSERDIQNEKFGSYLTRNYYESMCGAKKAIEFSTRQPVMFIKDGYGTTGAGGCNVDQDSNLRIGSIQTNPKCRISLYARPFATVPYLGRGPHRPIIESQIQQGDYVVNRKSCNTVTTQSFLPNIYVPHVPTLSATITNPTNLIEESAAEGWIRGGVPSRELIRDQDYTQDRQRRAMRS